MCVCVCVYVCVCVCERERERERNEKIGERSCSNEVERHNDRFEDMEVPVV